MFVGRIIEEHRIKRREKLSFHGGGEDDESEKDFVDVLLDLESGENKLSDSDMVAVLWVRSFVHHFILVFMALFFVTVLACVYALFIAAFGVQYLF